MKLFEILYTNKPFGNSHPNFTRDGKHRDEDVSVVVPWKQNANEKFYIPKKTLMVVGIVCQLVCQFVIAWPTFHSRAGNKVHTP